MTKQILLCGVFGPFGVDDEYGRKENLMELFHNQITKAQGLASLRFHHRTFGLYFLAENVEAPVSVLDFPSRERFIEELRRTRYDAIGISFIAPNFVKAREMARLIRLHQPQAEIILGGHGTAIENVENLIENDHVVRGEGLRWLRRYLGEDEHAPIHHPMIPSAEQKSVFGIPTPGVAGLLIPGVGCVNACRFCCTTHFFSKQYTSYFESGRALFDEACRLSEGLGTLDFFVMDENFLKQPERAWEFLRLMEQENKPFKLMLFSSAETVDAFGIENLARLGVTFLWIGAESKRETYQKNSGRDLKAMVRSLRDHGIFVLVSGILFLEHHTRENIQEDIDFLIDIEGVYTQFMMFTPMPKTALYDNYKASGMLNMSLPYEEWHGQHMLNFDHPGFTGEEATALLADAFKQEFDALSSSPLRMLDTTLRGYETLKAKGANDPWLAVRAEQMRGAAEELRMLLPTLARFAHNAVERERVRELRTRSNAVLGKPGLKARGLQVVARTLSEWASVRARFGSGVPLQPKTRLDRFRWDHAGSPASAGRAQQPSDPGGASADFVPVGGLVRGKLPPSAELEGAAAASSDVSASGRL